MNRVAIVTVLVLVGVAVGAVTATAQVESPTGESTPAAIDPGNESEANDTSNASLGASISAFMQSNSERASEAVDQGMWAAAFNRSDRARKQSLAESHVGTLSDRLDALAEQRQELIAAYRNGSLGKVEFQARMSALAERYRALNQSVDETKRAVGRENVEAPGLADLDRSLQRGGAAAAQQNVSLPENVTVPGFDRESNGFPFDNRTTGPPGEDAAGNSNGSPSSNATVGDGVGTNVNTTDDTFDGNETIDGNETLNGTVIGSLAGPSAEQTPF
jgi:hypothetical protein